MFLLKSHIRKSFKPFILSVHSPFSSFYDVVINGAGPVGASLACALSHSPQFPNQPSPSILLLDAQAFETTQEFLNKQAKIADQRVVTLTPGSIRFLKALGIWTKLDLNRVVPFYSLQVWESLGGNHFTIENDEKEMGRTIEIKHLQGCLFERIEELKRCEVAIPNSIEKIQQEDHGFIELELKDGRKIKTRLLVGSDGAKSKVKQFSKIPTYGWSYNQMGIVCTIETSIKEEKPKAFQRYLTNGPLALLPLWDSFYSIVWTVTLEEFEALMKLSDEKFLLELNFSLTKPSQNSPIAIPLLNSKPFHYPPLITRICNKRMAFPLNSLQSQRFVGNRLALIGDAAHSIHPMAGQGLNMGLADCMLIANEIIKNQKSGMDIGEENNLCEFEKQSKLMNYTMSIAMETIKTGFGVQNGVVSGLRSFALNGINSLGVLQDVMRKGADGDFFLPDKFLWEN